MGEQRQGQAKLSPLEALDVGHLKRGQWKRRNKYTDMLLASMASSMSVYQGILKVSPSE